MLALGRFVRQFTNFNRSASNARDTFPSRQGDIDAVVFSGGGARCFRQAGFRQTVQAALPRPDVVAAVNGGAALAAILFAGGWSRFFPRFLELAASSKGNVHLGDLPRDGRELYACPSRRVPVSTWDFSSPDKVIETFELGHGDGARFLGGQQARAPA